MTKKMVRDFFINHNYSEVQKNTWNRDGEKLCCIVFNDSLILCAREDEKFIITSMYRIHDIFRIRQMHGVYIEIFRKETAGAWKKIWYWILGFCDCERVYGLKDVK